MTDNFGPKIESIDRAIIAFSSKRLAEYINGAWGLASPTIAYSFSQFQKTFPGAEIRLSETPTYSCRSDRQCSLGSCSRPPGRCAWSCTVSGPNVPCPTWQNPFRTCPTSFDEPVCLGNRAVCSAQEEAAVARCQVDQAAQKLDCERIKGQENLGCEIGKAFVDGLARLGPIGRLGGDINATGGAELTSIDLHATADLSSVSLAGNIAATAQIAIGLDFSPLNVGHILTCPFPRKVFYRGSAAIPPQRNQTAAKLHKSGSGSLRSFEYGADLLSWLLQILRYRRNERCDHAPRAASCDKLNSRAPTARLGGRHGHRGMAAGAGAGGVRAGVSR